MCTLEGHQQSFANEWGAEVTRDPQNLPNPARPYSSQELAGAGAGLLLAFLGFYSSCGFA